MSSTQPNRRAFLTAATAVGVGAALGPVQSQAASGDAAVAFTYEVRRSLPEWLSMLSDQEFKVLRLNQTEVPKSSPLWEETRDGTYCCRGCDLTLYESDWKEVLNIGWVFFRHSLRDAVLTGIDDGPNPGGEATAMGPEGESFVEAHCRRCGSHLGHIVSIGGRPMHCINGVALRFVPTAE